MRVREKLTRNPFTRLYLRAPLSKFNGIEKSSKETFKLNVIDVLIQ